MKINEKIKNIRELGLKDSN